MDSAFSPWLLWFLAGVALGLAELVTPGFVMVFLGLGCWGAALVAVFLPDALTVQTVVFMAVSVASLLGLRRAAMRVFVGKDERSATSGYENYSGARVQVEKDVSPGGRGRVRFRGALWDARGEDPAASFTAPGEAVVVGVDPADRTCLVLRKP